MSWLYKSCPKCHGDLYSDGDNGYKAVFWTCLQCGYEGGDLPREHYNKQDGRTRQVRDIMDHIKPRKSSKRLTPVAPHEKIYRPKVPR